MGSDSSSVVAEELHVLAVDDCLVDRKVIEWLLKISSCKVTDVESGRRVLQYLGLDGEKISVGFDWPPKNFRLRRARVYAASILTIGVVNISGSMRSLWNPPSAPRMKMKR